MSYINAASDDLTAVVTLSAMLTAAGASDAVFVDGTVEGGAVRYRMDGTNPSTTEGRRLASGGQFSFRADRDKFSNVKIIRDGSDTPKIKWEIRTHQ